MQRCGSPPDEDEVVDDDGNEFFREIDGRRFSSMVPRYMLPVDDEESKRYELEHRIFQFVAGGNYVGPVRDVLKSTGDTKKRLLDLGTGCGRWAIEMADEFPNVEVIGCDCVPIQPRSVPPNCTFELFDMDDGLPYADASFDMVHARAIHAGITDYPRLLREAARVLRPGGLLLLVELAADSAAPTVLGKRARDAPTGAPGWAALLAAHQRALRAAGVDPRVPQILGQLVVASRAFDRAATVALEAEVPIGFHPKDPNLLSIGQLSWMNYDLLIPALRTCLAWSGVPDWQIDVLIEDAQRDLYYPVIRIFSTMHVLHAKKSL